MNGGKRLTSLLLVARTFRRRNRSSVELVLFIWIGVNIVGSTISQPKSVNIRLYLLTNRRCLSNDSSSRQYPQLSSRRSLLFRNRRRRHIALPLYLSLEICYVLPALLSFWFPCLSRCFFCFCFALLLLGYPNAQIFVIISSGSCL